MDGMTLSPELKTAAAFAEARPPQPRVAILRALFEARFAHLQALSDEWRGQLPESDWRMRLLHKALYSTWADLRDLEQAKEPVS